MTGVDPAPPNHDVLRFPGGHRPRLTSAGAKAGRQAVINIDKPLKVS